MLIKSIIIDDEPPAIKAMENLLKQIDNIEIASTFTNPIKGLNYLVNHKVDLVFLDINMREINGLELAKELPSNTAVVYTTAYSKYAVDSYETNAIDYLMKPIKPARLIQAISKVRERMSKVSSKNFAFIKNGTEKVKINFDAITWVESDGNYMKYCFTDQSPILIRQTIQQALEFLPSHQFQRVHRSFIIAIDAIEKVEVHQVHIGTNQIPIGTKYRASLANVIE